ncbi:hypothetical protein E8E13_005834 [Curvularia kusanoi]|uniref:Swi5-domain-containing protein n=1 Tax=Curvularia kusanoi TaxID=90978 RepID=A0A9P4TB02_CURKU|nr:hypothetical protein E8E13_005834 [Curvularia kusanoi]
MAIGAGVTEIADSDEEPLTSSPAAIGDAVADKLCVTARQDVQARAYPYQEPTDCVANDLTSRTVGLDVDQEQASTDLEMSRIDETDSLPVHQTATDYTACTTHDEQANSPVPQLGAVTPGNGPRGKDFEKSGACDGPSASQVTQSIALEYQMMLDGPAATPANRQGGVVTEHQEANVPHASLAVSTGVDVGKMNYPGRAPESEVFRSRAVTSNTSIDQIEHAAEKGHASDDQHTANEYFLQDNEGTASVRLASEPINHNLQLPQAASLALDAQYPLSIVSNICNTAARVSCLSDHGDQSQSAAATEMNVPSQIADRTDSTSMSERGLHRSGDPFDDDATRQNALAEHGVHSERLRSTDGSTRKTSIPPASLPEEANTDRPAETPARATPEDNLAAIQAAEEISQCVVEQVPATSVEAVSSCWQHHREANDVSTEAPAAFVDQTKTQSTTSHARQPSSPSPVAKLTPQEITLAELKAQKAGLLASLKNLPAIQVLIEENQAADMDISDDDAEPTDAEVTSAANKIVKEHIKLLHEYNELKDVGQGLMGLIADQRGSRIVEVQEEFGIDATD